MFGYKLDVGLLESCHTETKVNVIEEIAVSVGEERGDKDLSPSVLLSRGRYIVDRERERERERERQKERRRYRNRKISALVKFERGGNSETTIYSYIL